MFLMFLVSLSWLPGDVRRIFILSHMVPYYGALTIRKPLNTTSIHQSKPRFVRSSAGVGGTAVPSRCRADTSRRSTKSTLAPRPEANTWDLGGGAGGGGGGGVLGSRFRD